MTYKPPNKTKVGNHESGPSTAQHRWPTQNEVKKKLAPTVKAFLKTSLVLFLLAIAGVAMYGAIVVLKQVFKPEVLEPPMGLIVLASYLVSVFSTFLGATVGTLAVMAGS